MNHPDDTIVALSSAAGPGERAVVRISGSNTRTVVAAVFGEFTAQKNHLIDGELRLTGVHSPLPATLYFFQSPHSYTGQDLAELHTISSPPLIERLIADLLVAGARSAGPGEFTQRSFLAGKLDLTRAEAVQAVIDAGNDDDLKNALTQLAGNVARPLDALRDDLLNLLADVEAALDFVDEDIEFVTHKATLDRLAAGLAQLTNLRRQLDGRTVSGPALRVALTGKPNAGKSSLFNSLIGKDAALVSAVAGTTRDYLAATIALAGRPVELIDTAGLGTSQGAIDEQSQHLGRRESKQADIVLWCVESGQPFTDPLPGVDVIRVQTKCDLAPSKSDAVATSVKTPGGLDELRRVLTAKAAAFGRSPLAPSASRCQAHVDGAIDALRRAHGHALNQDPAELLALELRTALDRVGAMVGAVYTNDLLDRIFSRFCIGK